jgi:hypothetical protein
MRPTAVEVETVATAAAETAAPLVEPVRAEDKAGTLVVELCFLIPER